MAYISIVNNQAYTIGTGENSDQRDVTINGTKQVIDWRHIAPLAADTGLSPGIGGRYSLLIGGKSYEVLARRIVKPDEKDGTTYEVQVAGQRFEVHVEDEREIALTGSIKGARESGEAMIRAPMPGLVLGITLKVGTAVERGQTVVILEAMKMENDLPSPITGTIKEVRVNKGQTVNQGDVLVVVSGE